MLKLKDITDWKQCINQVVQGDCLVGIKLIPDKSIDLVLTDPPYEIGFMGKAWDSTGIANSIELWKEGLRVLKPGGYLLAFSATRTYHRMACAIEDAGFEVRDMVEWVYGSGFPKSLNIGKSINQLETNEWSKIGKALDNIDQKSIIEVWKSNSNNVKIVETQSLKNQIIAGQDTLSENFVVLNVVQNSNQENSNLLVNFAERNLNEVQATDTKINTALQSVEAEIRQLRNNVRSAEQQLQSQNHKSWNIFTVQCDVKEWLNENTEVNRKVDEALKTLRGNKKYSNEEIINVLCAVITNALKLTILNQSKTFQNLDTNQKMECVFAINVIITEYIMDNLISNTVAILKCKTVDKLQGNEREVLGKQPYTNQDIRNNNFDRKDGINDRIQSYITKGTSEWEGWGTALKPAHEPICMARKPLAEKTVAENCLRYGTGGINIDESRVGLNGEKTPTGSGKIDSWREKEDRTDRQERVQTFTSEQGRFPANLIHDNSEEVRECFPKTKSGIHSEKEKSRVANGMFAGGIATDENWYGDSGNASRFFKSIIYQAKASRSDRGEDNSHPTVKPTALMKYLLGLASRNGSIVLDPFMGSWTTAQACKDLGRNFIGFELEEKYCRVGEERLRQEVLL